jgi:cell division protein ZapA (FtsZ GTPase activity inhibitor)
MAEPNQIREALDDLNRRAQEAGDDPTLVVAALNAAVRWNEDVEELRDITRLLIEKALLARIPPQDLYGKPYSSAYVREIYNELREKGHDLPQLTRGPRPRRGRDRT